MGPAGFTSPSRKKNVTWPSCVSAGLLLNFGRSSLSRCKARFSIKLHSWSGQSWFMCQPGDRLSSFLITFSHVTRVSSCLSPTGPSVWRGENLPLKKKKGRGGCWWGALNAPAPLSAVKSWKIPWKMRRLQKACWSFLFNGTEHRTIRRVCFPAEVEGGCSETPVLPICLARADVGIWKKKVLFNLWLLPFTPLQGGGSKKLLDIWGREQGGEIKDDCAVNLLIV